MEVQMKFKIDASPKDNPNMIGELLRNEFFKEEYETYLGKKYRKTGCYSTFNLAEGVEELPGEPVDPNYPADGTYTVSQKIIDGKKIVMKYWWDGDGTLEFHFEDGSLLCNGDCKKDYVWEYYSEIPADW